ncbi:hypothetical protein QCA50_011290 [Cerrena zonata]|uniref:Uncharacterized protein n=1 Tax=Cerrena zonata TaxID=2478898 RepID=A0AAW0G1N5_9APHY
MLVLITAIPLYFFLTVLLLCDLSLVSAQPLSTMATATATFASSAQPLPAGWYRLPQETYRSKTSAVIDPLVVTFTAPGWPRSGGVPLNMAGQVENGADRPLAGVREPLNLTFRFLGLGYPGHSFTPSQAQNASSMTRRDLFTAASNALTVWLQTSQSAPFTGDAASDLCAHKNSGAVFSIASIYFPSMANIAQIEIIVIPSQRT